MIYGSVCSGIEGASVAWHGLGWKPAWFAEVDPFASEVLAQRWPGVPNFGDFTGIRPHWFRRLGVPAIDVLVGGTPCQSFSVAGKRLGLDDPRGHLTLEYLALARRLRPRWLVWENVPGVLSDDGGRTFGAVLGILGKLGYGFAYRVLDAQYFGVPQRRRRVFVVGHLGAWQPAAAVLFEPSCMRGDPPPSREAGQDVAGTLGAQPKGSGWRGDTDRMTFMAVDLQNAGLSEDLAGTIQGEGQATGNRGYGVLAFHGTQDPDVSGDVTHPLGRNHGLEACVAFDETQITSRANRSRPKPGDPCHTLTAGVRPPAIAAPMAVRRLTPRECERLQGFPDDYTRVMRKRKSAEDGPRYRALGNSFAVPVVRWIGERIAMVDAVLRGAA